jgi:hypothetical protein
MDQEMGNIKEQMPEWKTVTEIAVTFEHRERK